MTGRINTHANRVPEEVMPRPTSLETRVKRLEAVNRLLVGFCIVVGSAVVLAFTHPPAQIPELQARRIQLVDSSGRVRIDLRHDSTETGLFVMDEAGNTRLGIAQFAHGGGGIALHGPDMKGAAVLYLKDRGSLTFYDESGVVVSQFPTR
jgi:hypothetical protein